MDGIFFLLIVVYGIGLAATLAGGAVWLGRQWAMYDELIGTIRPGFQTLRYAETNRDSDTFEAAMGLLPIVVLWPVSLPLVAFFRRGVSSQQRNAALQKELDERNAELDQIRRQEGWA